MVLKEGATRGTTTGAQPVAPTGTGPVRALGMLWREVLMPIGVVAALLLLAVALIEGPPLEQFLYAVF